MSLGPIRFWTLIRMIRVMVMTHAYLYSDNTRYNWPAYGTGQYANPHAIPPVVVNGPRLAQ